MATGLPVHLNASFCVTKNRRTLQLEAVDTGDDIHSACR